MWEVQVARLMCWRARVESDFDRRSFVGVRVNRTPSRDTFPHVCTYV